ncbi:MAG: hypothetical protein JXM79_20305 [Sedimentisphaerales bacterium]|nr:hypothetical protein [Sedimentisphaerales bacterium]
MSKSDHTFDSWTVLLVYAWEADVARLHDDLPGWHWLGVSGDWPLDGESKCKDPSLDGVIVFAHKDTEGRTHDMLLRLYKKQELEDVSLFIVASRYQMDLAHEVKRLPRANFLFTPINKNELLDKMRSEEGVTS